MNEFPYPRYSYQVQPREVDLTKKATIFTLVECILHAAGEDADQIGFGVRELQRKNMTWVLSRMAVEVYRFPEEYERYTIGTWVGEISRLMTTRNFVVHDADDRRIAAASTCWAMIDMQSRLPLDLRENVDYNRALISEPCPVGKPLKIARVDGQLADDRRVRYSDVDFNQHTNTMKYIQWMIDTLPLERLTEGQMKRLDINFIHETRYGQQVQVYYEEGECGDRFEVRLMPEGTTACKAVFQWNKNR